MGNNDKPLGMSGGVPAGLDAIRHYIAMRDAKPFRQMDDVIHSVHIGTEWEAELRLSDLRLVATPTPPIEGRDADVERVARALAEYQIRQARRWDTDADVLEAMMPVAIEHTWPSLMPQARAALQALGERP